MKRTFYVKIIGGNYIGETVYTIVFARYLKYTIEDTEVAIYELIKKIKTSVEFERKIFHTDWADYKIIDSEEYAEGMEGIIKYNDMDLERKIKNGEL